MKTDWCVHVPCMLFWKEVFITSPPSPPSTIATTQPAQTQTIIDLHTTRKLLLRQTQVMQRLEMFASAVRKIRSLKGVVQLIVGQCPFLSPIMLANAFLRTHAHTHTRMQTYTRSIYGYKYKRHWFPQKKFKQHCQEKGECPPLFFSKAV